MENLTEIEINRNFKAPRVLVSSLGSGSGKTILSSGLMKLLKDKGFSVSSSKCGPDYIDGSYHSLITGEMSNNLDPFFYSEALLRASFLYEIKEINIIEGCMGLYDGIGVSREKSSYDVAKILKAPIILMVDAYGKAFSLVAEILGALALDSEKLIKAVVLNRIKEPFYKKISPVIEKETGLKILGYIPKLPEGFLESRHLGLKSPEENEALQKISRLSEILSESLDIDKLLKIINSSEDLSLRRTLDSYCDSFLRGKSIGIAYDRAFYFYYRDNLRAIELSGGKIKYFSPLQDRSLPEDLDAVYIGGGYPELYSDILSKNIQMLDEIKQFADKGKPVFAECGGYMYLSDSIDNKKMAGIFPGNFVNMKHLNRFGYIEAELNGLSVRGHEFHHYDTEDPGKEFEIKKISNGLRYRACKRYKNCIGGFPHLAFMSEPEILKILFRGENNE